MALYSRPGKWLHRLICIAALTPVAAAAAQPTAATRLDEQRQAFRAAYARAELGDWQEARRQAELLRDYVLWPDLRAAWLKTRVRNSDFADVDSYLDQFGTLKPARELRYHYALTLGHQQMHQQFLGIYQGFYDGLGIARLDCLALQAEIAAGRETRVADRGAAVWLVGGNQVEECDPVFDHLKQGGVIGDELYQQRFELALQSRQFAIARYLSRSLDTDYQVRAREWTAVVDDAEDYLQRHDPSLNSADYRDRLVYAAERLAIRRPQLAAELWRQIRQQYPFSVERQQQLDRHIALWAARRHSERAGVLLDDLPDAATDAEVLRWQARAGLLHKDWQRVIEAIEAMQVGDRQQDEWRYWMAVARARSGDPETSAKLLQDLSAERSYYGFLAADHLGSDYALRESGLVADESMLAELEGRAPILRARELFFVGLEGRGRSEWDSAVAMLRADEKRQASILAHRWGWHSRAIATAAQAGEFDDMSLRYPLPYRQSFARHAQTSAVPQSWAYGIARNESLFMRDIRSSAGAIGVMQLMPETGRRTARDISMPWSGQATLTDPDSNIRLGTAYLRKMLNRFDDHIALATAAYNAGPLNVEAWLPDSGNLDPQIWIANIPYDETREYVGRVLATDAIFQWRLTGKPKRVSASLQHPVSAAARAARAD